MFLAGVYSHPTVDPWGMTLRQIFEAVDVGRRVISMFNPMAAPDDDELGTQRGAEGISRLESMTPDQLRQYEQQQIERFERIKSRASKSSSP